MKITMEYLAKKTGVSKVAVHKAITGQSGVSEKKRAEILKLCADEGYVYKRPLLKKNSVFLCFIKKSYIQTEDEEYYSEIIKNLSFILEEQACSLDLVVYDPNIGDFNVNPDVKNTAGIFIAGELPDAAISKILTMGKPTVCIDYYSQSYSNINYVYLNDFYNSYQLTSYVIGKGHKQIGFIGNIRYASSVADRYFGYRKALLDFNLSFDRRWHVNENIDRRIDYSISLPEKLPTAFVCHSDSNAKKLYLALRFINKKIPETVSVASFDNNHIAEIMNPPLTSMGVEKTEFAQAAFDLMLSVLDGHPGNIQLKAKICERDSVCTL